MLMLHITSNQITLATQETHSPKGTSHILGFNLVLLSYGLKSENETSQTQDSKYCNDVQHWKCRYNDAVPAGRNNEGCKGE